MHLIQIDQPSNRIALPQLCNGFAVPLRRGEWAGVFPRHHLMWVSGDLSRVREFVTQTNRGAGDYQRFLTVPMQRSFDANYIQPLECVIPPDPVPHGELLSSSICLLTTNDCNLGCAYCFAGAQPGRSGPMTWEIAKAGVDTGIRNALLHRLRTGFGKLELRFFGGGEPTLYWTLYRDIVEYARITTRAVGIAVFISTITNGQIDEEHHQWFRDNVDEVTVSMDGPPDIQNNQRPTCHGDSSFDKSWKFLTRMDSLGMNIYAIRVTVTAETVTRMPEIALYFWQHLSKAYPLQFEPVYFSEVGRRNCGMPRALEFVEQLRRVDELGRSRHSAGRRHAPVGSATKPLRIRATCFCDSLEARSLFITPDGYLSLCAEISSASDVRAAEYFVGSYDPQIGRFHVTESGRERIRSGPPSRCGSCFAQFYCQGGCEPRSMNPDKNVSRAWCQMVRENVRCTWADVRSGHIEPRSRIGDPTGDELIWLPVWASSTSME